MARVAAALAAALALGGSACGGAAPSGKEPAAEAVVAKDDLKDRGTERAPGVQEDGEVVVAFPFFDGSFEAALAAAKAQGKLVLVDVGAYWCHSCHELEENVFTQARVGDRVRERFIAVKIDAEKDQGPELTERYRVQAYPTLLVLGANGVEMGRMVEVAEADELLAGLDRIAAGGDPLEALQAAVAAAPEDLEARYRLALGYALAARRGEAEAAYAALLAADPDNAKGYAAKALYNQASFLVANLDGDLEGAIAGYRALQERFPASREAVRAHRSIGRQLHKLGRSDEAIASLEAMIAAAPADVALKASYGWFSFRQRCHPEAGLRAVEAGLAAEPDNAELHYLRAELAHLVGDDALAQTSMRRAAELEPKTAYYRRQLRRFDALGGGARGGA
ncbi:MAG: thioredoxin family protein [Nannocystaceae bacterium]